MSGRENAAAPRTPAASSALERWRAGRAATWRFFDETLTPAAYEARPIALRHQFVFYEGHMAAFAVNTLLRKALGRPPLDADYEVLFERGIDPPADGSAPPAARWPARADVTAYARRADAAIADALASAAESHPAAVATVIEHELMHQETLRYMLGRLPYGQKRAPADARAPETGASAPRADRVRIPAGVATLGAAPGEIPFGWDNEFPRACVTVPSFTIDATPVTNADYLEFVEAGGYADVSLWEPGDREWIERQRIAHPRSWRRAGSDWLWEGQFELVPLPAAWPVWASHAEASAYARWKGRRLPTEAEYHRAAFGSPAGEHAFPWGDEPPTPARGNFGAERDDPVPVGSRPGGASAWGVHELVGNGWEWTSSPFAPFDGFQPMPTYPVYSTDFFDGRHFVLKGASPATPVGLVRRTFRNWFQGRYPYVFAKFRCVGP